jgi:hydroxysqualene synthase
VTAPVVEMPSGKDAAYENFPVGSWLLPAHLRPHIAIFYAFARAIDDVADSAELSADEKVRRLDGFEAALLGGNDVDGYDKAVHMAESLSATGVTTQHCLDLLAAFKQDAVKNRYDDFDDLIAYCRLSAAPVGRYLLDLHGGSDLGYGPSDALCNALQVINHLQDCQDDYRTLDRVYLPGDWMSSAGVDVSDLDAASASPGLRIVLDKSLAATKELLVEAHKLPGALASKRLALESAVIIDIADSLVRRLASGDPLASRIKLSKPAVMMSGLRGVVRGILA